MVTRKQKRVENSRSTVIVIIAIELKDAHLKHNSHRRQAGTHAVRTFRVLWSLLFDHKRPGNSCYSLYHKNVI